MTPNPTFDEKIEALPSKLRDIVEEFRSVDRQERMEYLLDYAMDLPPLPQRLEAARDEMEQVHECQAPVFLHTEVDESQQTHFYLDIPLESPTVRGYGAILVEGLDGEQAQTILDAPEDIYWLLGLQDIVTPQRVRGLHSLMIYMKRQVQKQM